MQVLYNHLDVSLWWNICPAGRKLTHLDMQNIGMTAIQTLIQLGFDVPLRHLQSSMTDFVPVTTSKGP